MVAEGAVNGMLQRQQVYPNRGRRRQIVRVARRVERISRVVLLWLLGLSLLYAGSRAMVADGLFAVQQIHIEGDLSRISEAMVRDVAGIAMGTNLFRLPLDEIQARLVAQPWIKAAAVRRKLPHTVWIYVQERQPVAMLNLHGLYLVDADGAIFKSVARDDQDDLPIVSGITDVAITEDRVGRSAQLDRLLTAYRLFAAHPLAERVGCSEILRDAYDRISIVTEHPAMQLRLGETPQATQFDQVLTILSVAPPQDPTVRSMDVYLERKVVVRYVS